MGREERRERCTEGEEERGGGGREERRMIEERERRRGMRNSRRGRGERGKESEGLGGGVGGGGCLCPERVQLRLVLRLRWPMGRKGGQEQRARKVEREGGVRGVGHRENRGSKREKDREKERERGSEGGSTPTPLCPPPSPFVHSCSSSSQ